jgi:hypothetical protein
MGKFFRRNQDLDASGDTGLTPNEAISFEHHEHLVDRGRADLKVVLHIGFCGKARAKMGRACPVTSKEP